ncbi:MAG: Rrf2 family transcriptional regulator [Pseudomonadota bacterium]
MKLTTKGRYAVTAMLDIAMHQAQGPVRVGDIASRQAISESYLEQIVGRLKRAALLESQKGPGGGYCLGAPLGQISIATIISTVGEGVDATRCAGKADCLGGHTCMTHNLWADLSDQLNRFLEGISLADLVAKQRSCNDDVSTPERIGATLL